MDDVALFWNLIVGSIFFSLAIGQQPGKHATKIADDVDEFFVPIPVAPSLFHDEKNMIQSEMNVERVKFNEVQWDWRRKYGKVYKSYRCRIGISKNTDTIVYHRLQELRT